MSPIHIPSNTLRDAKRLFGRLKHLRCKLPVLRHLLLTAGQNGIHLAVTDLDHWLETRVSDDGYEPLQFLIPPEVMETACRADRGSIVAFTRISPRTCPPSPGSTTRNPNSGVSPSTADVTC